jgi:hypothetical protein
MPAPISVARALAVAGQTVRVVYTEEPLHLSAAGLLDALNPANYLFEVAQGQGTAPIATVVSGIVVVGPARGVGNGGASAERGVDVSVDRQLALGLVYRVTVSRVHARAGGPLGAPTARTFPGVAAPATSRRPARPRGLVDLANPISTGAWALDGTGDLSVDDPLDGLRKRIFRRLTTPRDAYTFLPGYGEGLSLKEPCSLQQLAQYRGDAEDQIRREPEVADAAVQIAIDGSGVTTVTWTARLRTGGQAAGSFGASPTGFLVL